MRDVKAPVLKQDAQGNAIQDTYRDYAFRGQYSGTNLIYKGIARPGSLETAPVWQICMMTYDLANNLLSIKWPILPSGKISSDFEIAWSNRATYTFA